MVYNMRFKHSYIIFHLLSLYCYIGVNAEPSEIKPEDTSPRPAERACQEIISNHKSSVDNYIVDGDKAQLGELPHMVKIVNERPDGVTVDCGGALISSTYVLTAAHCLDYSIKGDRFIVRAGTLDTYGQNTKFDPNTDMVVAQKIIHPNYNKRLLSNDLALLRLPRPINITTNASPICLETNDTDPSGKLIIAGWGRTKQGGSGSSVLLKAYFEAVPYDKCKTTWGKYITKKHICAMSPTRKQDTCQGDSGGALILPAKDGRSKLEGVLSFGANCYKRSPKAFTRVSSYLSWIEPIVWPN